MKIRAARILDFDIENRPLSYMGGDLTTAEVTAIAWGWADSNQVWSALLGSWKAEDMLMAFRHFYESADIVTGHYIRKHDLPLINGALVEYNLPPLSPKLTSDTKLDLRKWSFETQPKSQEALGEALGLDAPKVHMTQADWREANRLTPAGIAKTRARVEGDVRQHKELRAELVKRGLLKAPRLWTP